MQVCTLLQRDNHASTQPLSFLQAGCPSCHSTNSVKALKAISRELHADKNLSPSPTVPTIPVPIPTGLAHTGTSTGFLLLLLPCKTLVWIILLLYAIGADFSLCLWVQIPSVLSPAFLCFFHSTCPSVILLFRKITSWGALRTCS